MLKRIARNILIQIGIQLQKYSDRIAQASLPKFGNQPNDLRIDFPRRIVNPERMFWGDHVALGPDSFLCCAKQYPSPRMQERLPEGPLQKFESRIIVGNNVTATGGLQLAAQSEIAIEDDVIFATNIHINDALHGFNNANEPYKYQPLFRISPIRIRRGAWIGQNVVILPGVTVGELAIIGANSVVTKSIPDRCIAVGNPARVTKRWDAASGSWVGVK